MYTATHFPAEKKSLFVLTENSFLRYFSFASLYFAQGIPNGLLWYAFPAWFAMHGKSAVEIGSFIVVIGLPWSFKIIAAPLMDRFTYLPMGRRKPWILFGQAGLTISFLALALTPEPLDNLRLLMIFGFFTSFFSIFQDIAVDGLAIDILPPQQQARANGIMWGSKIIGSATTVAVTSYFINHYGFFTSMLVFALFIFGIMFIPTFTRERSCEKLFPWSSGKASPETTQIQAKSWKSIVRSLTQVVILPSSIFMGIAAFSFFIGEGLIDAILPVFTVQELGWTDAVYSQTFATTTLVSGLLAMFIGGALIDFFGKIRMVVIYISLLIVVIASMAFLTQYWTSSIFVRAFFFSFYTLNTFLTIAVFAIAMQLCWKRISATQFTLYMAVSNLGSAAGAWIMGLLTTYFEWRYIIAAYLVFIVIMLLLVRFIRFDTHLLKIDSLEQKYISNEKSAA